MAWGRSGTGTLTPAVLGTAAHLTRRRFLRSLAGLGGLSLGAACRATGAALGTVGPASTAEPDSSSTSSSSSSSSSPSSSAELVVALAGEPDSLDPAHALTLAAEAVGRPIYDGLVSFGPGFEPRPALAEKWTVSADGLTYAFGLRRGVRFHDGSGFGARAAQYNLERLLGETKPARRELLVGLLRGARTVDEYTLELRLERPFSGFLHQLAQYGAAMSSPDAQRAGPRRLDQRPIGSGPFRFVEWARGERLTLERWDEGWRGRAGLERVIFKFVPDEQARLAMLERGEVQLAGGISPHWLGRVRGSERLGAEVVASARALGIAINTQAAAFNDRRVRQALNYAVDKEALASAVYGGQATPLGGPVAAVVRAAAALPPYPYDPTRAQALLAEAGRAGGLEATLLSSKGRLPGDAALAREVHQQLQALGLKTRLEIHDGPIYGGAVTKTAEETALELTVTGWLPPSGEARQALYPLFHSTQWVPRGFNNSFFKDAQLDELLDRGARAVEPAEREHLFRRAQELLHEEAPWIFLLSPKTVVAHAAGLHEPLLSPSGLVSVSEKTWLEE